MNKRLNFKLLGGLLGGSFVFMLVVYFLHDFQVKRNADALLVRAQARRDEGDLSESIRIMSRYLAHRPDDASQYKVIALDSKKYLIDMVERRVQPKKQVVDRAINLMEEAVRQNGTDIETRREAADLWFRFGRHDYVIENLEVFRSEWTVDDRIQYVESLRLSGGPNEAKAITELNLIVGYDPETREYSEEKAQLPNNLQAYQSLATLQISALADNDEAKRVLDQMVSVNEDNYEAYLIRSRMIRMVTDADDATDIANADIDRAFELAPGEIDAIYAKATMLMGGKEYSTAHKLVTDALSSATLRRDKSRLHNLLTQLAVHQDDPETAIRAIEDGLREVPLDRELLWTKSRLLVDANKHDEVEVLYKEMRRAGIQEPLIAYLQSRILIAKGDYLKASKNLVKLRTLVSPILQYEVDVYLSKCYEVLGQPDSRLAAIDRMLKFQPADLTSQVHRVTTLAQLGRNGEALTYLRGLKKLLAASGAEIPASIQQLDATLEISQLMVKPEEERDWKAVEAKVAKIWGNEEIGILQKIVIVSDLFKKEGKTDKAKEWIRKGLEEEPEQFQLWAMLVDLADTREEAYQTFADMERTFDDRVPLRVLRAKLAIKYQDSDVAEVMAAQERDSGKFSSELQSQLFYELGTLYVGVLDNRNEGMRLMEAAHQKNPKRLDVLGSLFDSASRGSDATLIVDIVKRIENITTRDDDNWKLHEARRIAWFMRKGLVDQDNRTAALNQARQLMRDVRANRPGWLPVLLLESDIHRLNSDISSAIQSLEQALELQPSNPQLIRILAQMYKEAGQIAKAEETLAKLPATFRSRQDNRSQLALLEQRGQIKEAVELMDVVIPADSESNQDQLWRSQILLRADDLAGAEVAARKALQIEQGDPKAWVNLVDILAKQNKTAEAEEVLQEVEGQLAENMKPLVLGQCYVALGNLAMAQQSYMTALKSDRTNALVKQRLAALYIDNKQLQPAVGLLQDIINSGDPAKDENQIVWSRRQLAQILSETNGYANFLKALELVEQNAKDGELAPRDLGLWVLMCARRQEVASWQKAVNRLEKIEAKRALSDDELFFRAQLYEKFGDGLWKDVKSITTALLARNPGNQKIIENWVRWLLKRGEIEQAEVWKRQLSPTSVTRVRVEAHALAAASKHQEAARKLNGLVPKELDSKPAYEALITVSALAEELGQYDKRFYLFSESLLRKLVAKLPTESLRLASSIGLHGDSKKINDALKMCISVEEKGIPTAFGAAIATAILREHSQLWKTDLKSAISAVERWMDQQLIANPDDFAMKIRVAEFHDVLGNLDRVEKEYSEVLSSANLRNPLERGMILNNLAYAMAVNGKTDEPLKLINEATNALGPSADIIDTRGYIHLVRGDYDEAVKDLKAAVATGTRTSQKLFHLALALHKQGNQPEAKQAWIDALDAGLMKEKLPPALSTSFEDLFDAYGGSPTGPT